MTARETRFAYALRRVRVVFGAGTLEALPAELTRLAVRRAMAIATPGRAKQLASVRDILGTTLAGAFERARLHVPAAVVTDALEELERMRPDCLIALGGGSAIGLAKAMALQVDLPIVAVPTTYSGSEMTAVWGVTDGDEKRTGREPRVAPRAVVYDPALTRSLPALVSAASGMNAIAHAVEALYAPDANPIATAAAPKAIRRLARALPEIVRDPANGAARAAALEGAHLAGCALDLTSMGLHHTLCHVLGGTFGLPHAETHAVLLPHVAAYYAPAWPEALERVARALGALDAATGLRALADALGLPGSLAALGLRAADLPEAAARATGRASADPRSATTAEVLALLERAHEGRLTSS